MAEALAANNVTAGYDVKKVLHDFTLSVDEGELTGLIGPNGAGKTSVLRLFTSQIQIFAGGVRVLGVDAAKMPDPSRGRTIAVLAQEHGTPAPLTVYEVVMLGRLPHLGPLAVPRKEDLDAVDRAVEELSLQELLWRRYTELSGGERQRVLLARALAQEPRILILDEPTTHLDIGHQKELMDLLLKLRDARSLTVLISLHNLSLAGMYLERLVLLSDGKIFADGTPSEVLRKEMLEEVYRTQLVLLPGGNGTPIVSIEPRH
jgi:iron complex transport system ATP-binding protein